MKLIINTNSNIGQVSSKNEDMILIGNDIWRDNLKTYSENFNRLETVFIAGVADGMGGHKGGDYASEFVANKLNLVINQINKSLEFQSLKEEL